MSQDRLVDHPFAGIAWGEGRSETSGPLAATDSQEAVDESVQDILVFGYAATTFRNDETAREIDHGKYLVPYVYDNSYMFDRYDGRNYLSDLVQYKKDKKRGHPKMTHEEKSEFELLQDARYRDYYKVLKEKEEEEEIAQKAEEEKERLVEEDNQSETAAAVGFDYTNMEKESKEESKEELKKEKVVIGPTACAIINGETTDQSSSVPLPFEVDVPMPKKIGVHLIIQHTANFMASNSAAVGILLVASQKDNPLLRFLNPEHPLHPYFNLLLQRAKANQSNDLVSQADSFVTSAPLQNHTQPTILPPVHNDNDGVVVETNDETSDNLTQPIILQATSESKGPDQEEGSAVISDHVIGSEETDMFADDSEPLAATNINTVKSPVYPLVRYHDSDSEDEDDIPATTLKGSSSDGPPLGTDIRTLPPHDIEAIIKNIAAMVANHGTEFEERLKEKHGKDPKYEFLLRWSPYHSYYLQMVDWFSECAKDPGQSLSETLGLAGNKMGKVRTQPSPLDKQLNVSLDKTVPMAERTTIVQPLFPIIQPTIVSDTVLNATATENTEHPLLNKPIGGQGAGVRKVRAKLFLAQLRARAGSINDQPSSLLGSTTKDVNEGISGESEGEREIQPGAPDDLVVRITTETDPAMGKGMKVDRPDSVLADTKEKRDKEKDRERSRKREKGHRASTAHNHSALSRHKEASTKKVRKGDKERERERERSRDREIDRSRFRDREKSRERERDRSRDREREKSRDRDREKSRERDREKSRERDREKSREREREKSREREREKSRDRDREKSRDREREKSRDIEREKSRDRDREKSRDRERDKSRERERERSRDRDREKSRDRDRERSRDRERDKSRDREREKSRDREREKSRDREREKSRDREREKSRDREREKSRDREREKSRDRERDRERGRGESRRDRSRTRSRGRSQTDRDREDDRGSRKESTREDKGKREKERVMYREGHSQEKDLGENSSTEDNDNKDSSRGREGVRAVASTHMVSEEDSADPPSQPKPYPFETPTSLPAGHPPPTSVHITQSLLEKVRASLAASRLGNTTS